MFRLDFEYVSKKYNLDDDDDYDEEYNKYNRYNYSDYILTISFSFILFFYMIQKMQKFDTWPTLNLGRINIHLGFSSSSSVKKLPAMQDQA